MISPVGDGFAGVYHQYDPVGWPGPTGFYSADYRTPPAPDQNKTWDSLYAWADLSYAGETMPLSFRADTLFTPPIDRRYRLELLQVPEGVSGAPPVGTLWELPQSDPYTLELPTFRTADGLEGYRFSFTISEVVPEPGALTLLAVGTALLATRRRYGR